MTKKFLIILACCLFATTGCNLVYKQNIQQGNAIEQDKLDQLKIGMTMNQVAYLLGTPAIRDPFHQSRWDYYYSFAIRGGDPVTRLVTLKFENAVLREMTGVDPDYPDKAVTADSGADEPAADPAEISAAEVISPQTGTMPDEAVPDAAENSVTIETVAEPVAITESIDEAVTEAAAEVTDETLIDVVDEVAEDVTDEQPPAIAVEPEPGLWVIQMGAFDSLENAKNLVATADDAGFRLTVTPVESANTGVRYLVRTEGFENRVQANRQLEMINSALGVMGFLVPPGND